MRVTVELIFGTFVLIAGILSAGCLSPDEYRQSGPGVPEEAEGGLILDIVDTRFENPEGLDDLMLHVQGVTNLPDDEMVVVLMITDQKTNHEMTIIQDDGYIRFTPEGIHTAKYAVVADGRYSAQFTVPEGEERDNLRLTTALIKDNMTQQGNVVSLTRRETTA